MGLAVIGMVLGGILGGFIPIHFEWYRSQGVEAVRLHVLGVQVR